MKDKIEMYIYN